MGRGRTAKRSIAEGVRRDGGLEGGMSRRGKKCVLSLCGVFVRSYVNSIIAERGGASLDKVWRMHSSEISPTDHDEGLMEYHKSHCH